MPHLFKSGTTGHLLKTLRGHLALSCDLDPCNLDLAVSGGYEGFDRTFGIYPGGFTLILSFTTYAIPDTLIVYIDGREYYNSGPVATGGDPLVVPVPIPFGSVSVRIVVIGSEEWTEWALTSRCEKSSSSSSSSSSGSSESSSSSPGPCAAFQEQTVVDCKLVPGGGYASGSALIIPATPGTHKLTLYYAGSRMRLRLKEGGIYGTVIKNYGCTTSVSEVVTVVAATATVYTFACDGSTCGSCPFSYYISMGLDCV